MREPAMTVIIGTAPHDSLIPSRSAHLASGTRPGWLSTRALGREEVYSLYLALKASGFGILLQLLSKPAEHFWSVLDRHPDPIILELVNFRPVRSSPCNSCLRFCGRGGF